MANNLDKLKIDEVLKFDEKFWKRIAERIKLLIEQDMDKGKCQAYTANPKYLSATYKKYKANYMKRFSNKVSSNIAGSSKGFRRIDITAKNIEYFKKHKPAIGQNIKAYAGVSVKSNWIASVNMKLTGQTIQGLEYYSSTPTSVKLRYKDKDGDKILGNEDLGRFITTLNDKNQDIILKMIADELDENIREFYREKITLVVGKGI